MIQKHHRQKENNSVKDSPPPASPSGSNFDIKIEDTLRPADEELNRKVDDLEVEEMGDNDRSDSDGEPLTPLWEDVLNEVIARDDEGFAEDDRTLKQYRQQGEFWLQLSQTLRIKIEEVVTDCQVYFNEVDDTYRSLPIALQERLQTRQSGLELIEKMLSRLNSQSDRLEMGEEMGELPRMSRDMCYEFSTDETRDRVREILDRQLQSVERDRWDIIFRSRQTVDRYRQRWLKFIETRVLKVVDGIDSGLANSQGFVTQLPAKYPDDREKLDRWLATYSTLSRKMLDLLSSVGVIPIAVFRGMAIDYEKHEPLEVEPDDTLADERIKTVIRQGYKYQIGDDRGILRPAQVVVVKNEIKEENNDRR